MISVMYIVIQMNAEKIRQSVRYINGYNTSTHLGAGEITACVINVHIKPAYITIDKHLMKASLPLLAKP